MCGFLPARTTTAFSCYLFGNPNQSHPMKPVFIIALIAACVSVQRVQAQSGTVTKALIELENKWVDALVRADTARLDAIFAETYVDTEEGEDCIEPCRVGAHQRVHPFI